MFKNPLRMVTFPWKTLVVTSFPLEATWRSQMAMALKGRAQRRNTLCSVHCRDLMGIYAVKKYVLTHQKFGFHPEIRDLSVSENDDKPFFESNQFLHRQTTEYSVFHSESSILSAMGSRCWPQCWSGKMNVPRIGSDNIYRKPMFKGKNHGFLCSFAA